MITNLKSHLLTGKKLLILLLFVFMMGGIVGQNLVPNGSFENIDTCYLNGAEVMYGIVTDWGSPTNGSPDALNSCSTLPSHWSSVPTNRFGFQYAHSGNGYVGELFYSTIPGGAGFWEYIQAKLDTSLISQEVYCVSFYVNLPNKVEYASNNIGLYISDTVIHNVGFNYLPLTPQINDTTIVSDTANWTLIYGQYVAHGGERYIVIGNFFPLGLTDTIHYNQLTEQMGYYFIDDVNLHCCSCDSTTHLGVSETNPTPELTIYPNPCASQLGITNYELGITHVHIYNALGLMVNDKWLMVNRQSGSIDVSRLPSGLYFAEIETEKGVVRRKFVKE